MYLLPWHSLSKTGSHLSTSIRWYSMGQPLSLAMIISDVTSCPETIPYAVFDVHRSRYLLLSRKRSCKRRDRFYSKDLLFLRSLPYHYWSPIKNKKKRKNRHGWNPELAQFLLSASFENRPRFSLSSLTMFVHSTLTRDAPHFRGKVEDT